MQELILIIEDEPQIARLSRDYLERQGYRVLVAADGPAGLAVARAERPDLVLLDILLPGLDGREVCRRLRAASDVPIIMLTALAEESDQIVGLELGADDYIVKPFSPNVLVARVRAALRRASGQLTEPAVLRSGDLTVDTQSRRVTLGEKLVHVTPNEYKLLAALARRPGQTLTREQLLDELHGAVALTTPGVDRSVDSHIKNLRRKLEPEGAPRRIETIYGVGYRLLEPS